MSPLPSREPAGSRKPRRVHWSYVSTKPGAKWHAYIAGRCLWQPTHEVKRLTKPCAEEITGGEISCPHCARGMVAKEVGYLPLYRGEDTKPVLILLHDYTRDVVDALRLHQRVLVGRGESAQDGYYCIAAPNPEPKFHTRDPQRMANADPSESVLKLWGDVALAEWYYATFANVEPPPAPPPPPPPPPRVAELPDDDNGDLSPLSALIRGRLSKYETNGKHE